MNRIILIACIVVAAALGATTYVAYVKWQGEASGREQAETELKAAKAQLQKAADDLQNAKILLDSQGKKIDDLQAQAHTASEALTAAQAKGADLETQLRNAQDKVETLGASSKDLDARLTAAQAQIQEFKGRETAQMSLLKETERKMGEQRARADTLEAQLAKATADAKRLQQMNDLP